MKSDHPSDDIDEAIRRRTVDKVLAHQPQAEDVPPGR
jgi:hypothetical protein